MKVIVKRIVIIVMLLVSFVAGMFMTTQGDAARDYKSDYRTIYLVDYETGVNYIVFQHTSTGKFSACPRYNTDGSLYVTQ